MPLDPSIGLDTKTPSLSDALAPISSMLGIAQGAQNLQQSRAIMPSAISSAQSGARTASAGSQVAEANVAPNIAEKKAQAETAQAQASGAQLDLAKSYLNDAMQSTAGLITKEDLNSNDIASMLTNHAKMTGTPNANLGAMISQIPDSKDPKVLRTFLQQQLIGLQDKAKSLESVTPQVQFLNTGQQAKPVNVNPLAGPVGTTMGESTQMQLPPTTPTFNKNTNTPGYLGPQENGKGKGQIQSGAALGTEANIGGTVKAVNDDWQQTVAQAGPASQNIGVLQNIKQLAPGAVTGVANDRRSFLAGLGGLIGMSPAQMEKTDTDLLAKNSNMLALAGGNTDAARALAEAANPNSHMTAQAITHAADQVIAQQQLMISKQQYMGQFKGDPDQYSKSLTRFNAAADPRIFQLKSMTPQEKAQMKAAMSPSERHDFGNKIRAMQSMGIVQ